jgi:hypothetical protein
MIPADKLGGFFHRDLSAASYKTPELWFQVDSQSIHKGPVRALNLKQSFDSFSTSTV